MNNIIINLKKPYILRHMYTNIINGDQMVDSVMMSFMLIRVSMFQIL